MKKLVAALFGVIVAASFAASAASLKVDAGVLQAWSFDVAICADSPGLCQEPDEQPGNIRVSLLFYNSGGQVPSGLSRGAERDFVVADGSEYRFVWAGAGDFTVCPQLEVDQASTGSGPFVADGVSNHVLCFRGDSPQAYNRNTADPASLNIVIDEPVVSEPAETEGLPSLAGTPSGAPERSTSASETADPDDDGPAPEQLLDPEKDSPQEERVDQNEGTDAEPGAGRKELPLDDSDSAPEGDS